MKNNKFLLILIIFFLTGCQSIKDGLTGQKSENSDEFLVEKKNPLVMPPNFMELPEPELLEAKEELIQLEENSDIKKILNISETTITTEDSSSTAEDFILEQIQDK